MLAVASLVSTPPHRPSLGAQRVSRVRASGTRRDRTGNDQQRGDEPEDRQALDWRLPRRQEPACKAQGRDDAPAARRGRVDRVSRSRPNRVERRDPARFSRRRCGSGQRQHHANREGARDVDPRQSRHARRFSHVERRHGRRREANGRVCKGPARANAHGATGDSERQRLAQKQRQHPPARDAECAQHADLPAPRDDRRRHRVVNEKEPDEHRDPRERRQVELERCQHPLDLRAAARRPLNGQPRWQTRRDDALGFVQPGRIRQPQVHAIDPAEPIEGPLRGGDVHEDEIAVHHPGGALVPEKRANDERVHHVADRQGQRAAGHETVTSGESLAHHNRRRIDQQTQKRLRGSLTARCLDQAIVPNRLVLEDVDAKDAHGFGAALAHERHRVALDHGADIAPFPEPPERAQPILGDAQAGAGDLERRPAGHRVESGSKPADRALVRQPDCQHDAHAQRDAGDSQHRPHGLRAEPPQDEPAKEGHHGLRAAPRPSPGAIRTIRPSRMCTTRSAAAATSAE